MSQRNVELVRRGIEMFNRGDIDSLLREMDPEIEWHDQPELPGATIHYGSQATVDHLRSALRDLPGYRVDPEEFLDAEASVVVCGRISAHGRASGAPVERPYFADFATEAGRIRRARLFGTRQEALEAAGLSE